MDCRKFWRIEVNLKSPVVSVPSLDSLLVAQYYKKQSGGAIQHIQRDERINPCEADIGIDVEQPNSAEKFYACSNPIYHESDLTEEHIASRVSDKIILKTKSNKNETFSIQRGSFRSVFIPICQKEVKKVIYFVRGDRIKISDLLSGVCNFGKYRKLGKGEVSEFRIQETEKDMSIIYKDILFKTVPKSYVGDTKLRNKTARYIGYRPPYWHIQNKTLCETPI